MLRYPVTDMNCRCVPLYVCLSINLDLSEDLGLTSNYFDKTCLILKLVLLLGVSCIDENTWKISDASE